MVGIRNITTATIFFTIFLRMEEPSFLDESFQANEQSLFAEMNSNFPGEWQYTVVWTTCNKYHG